MSRSPPAFARPSIRGRYTFPGWRAASLAILHAPISRASSSGCAASSGVSTGIAPVLIDRPRRARPKRRRGRCRASGRCSPAAGRENAEALEKLGARLAQGVVRRRAKATQGASRLRPVAGAVSYRGVLARGFALVRDEARLPLRRAAEVREGQALRIEFADGEVLAAAGATLPLPEPQGPPEAMKPKRGRRSRNGEGQGSLF